MAQPQFILKTTPPRLPRTAVVRRALAHRWDDLQDRMAIVVSAPRGFGKTTLLAQWRRAWLERGAYVAWVTLDGQDSPARFAEVLLAALYSASGRGTPDTLAAKLGAIQPGRESEALTALLAEIANLATITAVILDDADRLPAATLNDALSYLLYNAPPNLRLIIGARGSLPLAVPDLVASGDLAAVGVDELRLALDDTVEILLRRFGDRLTLDDCVKLHEITEGWPIGLQMAASTIERSPHPAQAIADLNARRGDIERYFLESMLAQLPAELGEFLVQCSMLESMTPELCAAVTENPAATLLLEQSMRDTPIVIVGEGQGWMRLHTLARDFLLGRYENLPTKERHLLHARAARWYADHQHLREAARHALESGDESLAFRYAATSLREIAREGRLAEAHDWMRRLPPAAFERDVYLRLTAAWVKALGDEASDVYPLVDPVVADTEIEPHARFEAALIGAAAGIFCDQPGLVFDYMSPWMELPPTATPLHAIAHANSIAAFDLYRGATQQVRARLERVPRNDADAGQLQLALAYTDVWRALSYMWEGRPAKADAILQPALERAERAAGRRSTIAAMLAGILSGAVFEQDQPARARALLANRLDVIDRIGTPDAILIAYRTLADLALFDGDERRALDVLVALRELGERRRIHRMAVVSLAEQIRIHALHARPETAAALFAQLESVGTVFEQPSLLPLQPFFRLKEAIARTYLALAAYDDAKADRSLKQAADLAEMMNRGREVIMVKALQAVLMDRQRPGSARAKMNEARDLAAINGFERLIRGLHPATADILGETRVEHPAPVRKQAAAERSAVALSGGLLTAKETEVLGLLANGLSNKLIARTMDISDETVKWHLKNLFSKLDAGTRRHAVDRARLLGLVG